MHQYDALCAACRVLLGKPVTLSRTDHQRMSLSPEKECVHVGRGRGREAAEQAAAEAARQAAMLRHSELVASARKDDGPISIGGMHQLSMTVACEVLAVDPTLKASRRRLVSQSLEHLLERCQAEGLPSPSLADAVC